MADITKNLPFVFGGITIPGVYALDLDSLVETWTVRGQQTPTFKSTPAPDGSPRTEGRSYWKEYAPGQSVTQLVELVPTVGQPPSETAKYRKRGGFRISKNVTPNLEEIIFTDLLS